DYQRAGVPMMAVVKGEASTRLQILIYSLILVPLALAPAATGLGGPVYLAVAALGGAVFVYLAARVSLPIMGRDSRRASDGRVGDSTEEQDVAADTPTLAASQPSLP